MSVLSTFEGLTNADNRALAFSVLPSDANLAVGPSHIFQMVNVVGRITDRSGGNAATFSLGSFFAVDPGFQETDPRVQYDALSGRWFATYFQFSPSSSSIILAVSTTTDPTATFCRYRLGNPTTEAFAQDFPMLGISDDKIVVSYNGFAGNTFVGAGYYVVNKADVLACSTPRVTRVPPDFSRFTPSPAHSLSSTSDLFMAMNEGNTLALFRVSGVPGVGPVTETTRRLPIRDWRPPPDAEQPGSPRLDTSDESVISVTWQHGVLWLAGNERCSPAGDTGTRSCLRLIEVRTDSVIVRQDMSVGAAGKYYYYPALRPDVAGNLYVVFNISSSTEFAGVHVTGRLATDPLNTLIAPIQIRAGGGAQRHPSGRMGDYHGAAVDPVDPRVVWVNGEYIRATGSVEWGSIVAQLTLADTAPPPTLSLGLDQTSFTGGQTLRLSVTLSNPGPTRQVNGFLGALLAPSAFPCPAGDPVAFIGPQLTVATVTCLSTLTAEVPPVIRDVTLPAGLPSTTLQSFFSFVWPSTAPVGSYVLFAVFTGADAPALPPSILSIGSVPLAFTP